MTGQSKTSSGWDAFNAEQGKQAIEKEADVMAKSTGVDPELYKRLRERKITAKETEILTPEKPSFLKELGTTALQTIGGLFESGMKGIRATSQLAAVLPARALGGLTGGKEGADAATKEALRMAKEMVTTDISSSQAVTQAAQQYLEKTSEKDPLGGYKPTISNVAALSTLAIFNLFGDPLFEVGVLKPAYKSLKELALYKKIGQTSKELPEGAKFVSGTGKIVEIPISPDVKIKIEPKTNEIRITAYKKRFPTQQGLPEGQLAKETEDLLLSTKEITGKDVVARFDGDDLVIKPVIEEAKPIAESPLLSEAGIFGEMDQREMLKLLEKDTLTTVESSRLAELQTKERAFYEQTEPIGKQIIEYQGEKENQYQDFSALLKSPEFRNAKVREAIQTGDIETLKGILKEKNIPPKAVDNLFYSQEQTADEVLNDFKSRITDENPQIFGEKKTFEVGSGKMVKTPIETILPSVKPSRVAANIEARAVEKGLADSFGEIAGYTPITIKDQAERATNLLNSDFEKAKRMIAGIEPMEPGLRGEMLVKVMEDYALRTEDAELLGLLANSPIVSETSVHAQSLRLLRERNPESPVDAIRSIAKVREENFIKKTKKTVEKAKKEVVDEIKKEVKKPTKESWDDFISSITCA